MDALQMLREDHRKVKALFRRFEEAEDKATKQAAAEAALVELNIHSILEQEIFYPAVRRGSSSRETVERAEQEHRTAEQLMDELMNMEPANRDFDAKFHVLIANIKSHIDEEETEILPQAAEAGLARMEQLGERMEARRAELMSAGNGRRLRSTSGGTRAHSASATRSRPSSSTRARSASGARTKASSGSRSASGASRPKTAGRTTTQRAGARTTGTRSKMTSRPQSVVRAGARKRATQTRSKTGKRRNGTQSTR